MDILILCGGLGTRLQSVVADRPKALAMINGRPFLSYQLDLLKSAGFKRFVFCIGYKADMIKDYIRSILETELEGCDCLFSEEPAPLGTGGAIFNAREYIQSEKFMVVNGDSFCDVDLNAFSDFHAQHNALMSLVLVSIKDMDRYGVVFVDGENKIQRFSEKGDDSESFDGDDYKVGGINAGIYILSRNLFEDTYHGFGKGDKFSIETEFFPHYVGHQFYGYKNPNSTFIDIGIPSSLEEAQTFFKSQ